MKHPTADQIEILFDKNDIQNRIEDLGRQISNDYADASCVLVGVLKGAAVFLSDLLRNINADVTYDFVAISSYGADTKSSGVVRLIKDVDISLEGEHILIVEDIVDSGLTLSYLLELLQTRKPASIKVCALLDKPSGRQTNVKVDYVGFEIPDSFVVGYGMDIAERYRNLPFIGILKSVEK